MGRSVTKAALSHGDLVCAVGQSLSDTPATLSSLCPSSSGANTNTNTNTNTTANTNSTADDSYLGLLCDVRIRPSVSAALDATLSHFGRIDIIANCSGYGVIGACEDQDEHEIRNQFETNFMGTLNMIQLSLPYFRRRQAGRYLIFSSTSGALGVPGLGPYCATKYAVEGLIESMLYEVDPFGIKVTLVEPGHLRRDDDHGSSCPGSNLPSSGVVATSTTGQQNNALLPTPTTTAATTTAGLSVNQLPLFGHFKVAKASEPYAGKDAPAAHAQRTLHWMGNQQPTSVVKAAELVWQLGHCRYPPLRLLLGSFAVESIRDRLKSIIEEIEDWKHLSFPPLDPDPEAEGEGEGEDDGEGVGEEDDDNDDDRDDDEDDDDDNNEDGDQIDIKAARNKGHGASRAIKAESMMDVDE
jgi:NAD(P)-dependent dehydrogenase (short-subunit alcohol dehydrogenase family)